MARTPKNPRSKRDLALIEKKIEALQLRIELRDYALEKLGALCRDRWDIIETCEKTNEWAPWEGWSLVLTEEPPSTRKIEVHYAPTLAEAIIEAESESHEVRKMYPKTLGEKVGGSLVHLSGMSRIGL